MKIKINLKPRKPAGFRGVLILLGLAFLTYALFTRGSVPWIKPVKTPSRAYTASTIPTPPVVRPVEKPREVAAPARVQAPIWPKVPSTRPKIAIVIDDIGHTANDLSLLRRLGNQVTYAILPLLAYSQYFGELSQETGAEVILHLPMQSETGTIPGPGLITDRMPEDYVREILNHNLNSVPYHTGVNNHMGSRGTANPALMKIILQELKKRRLFFLDSFTTPSSVGVSVANSMKVPSLKRDIFLDNIDTQEAVREKLRELAAIARQNGFAVGIGHYRYNTLTVLNEEIPQLWDAGFEMVSLSDMIRSKKAA